MATQAVENNTFIKPRLSVVRFDPYCLLKSAESILVAPQTIKGNTPC